MFFRIIVICLVCVFVELTYNSEFFQPVYEYSFFAILIKESVTFSYQNYDIVLSYFLFCMILLLLFSLANFIISRICYPFHQIHKYLSAYSCQNRKSREYSVDDIVSLLHSMYRMNKKQFSKMLTKFGKSDSNQAIADHLLECYNNIRNQDAEPLRTENYSQITLLQKSSEEEILKHISYLYKIREYESILNLYSEKDILQNYRKCDWLYRYLILASIHQNDYELGYSLFMIACHEKLSITFSPYEAHKIFYSIAQHKKFASFAKIYDIPEKLICETDIMFAIHFKQKISFSSILRLCSEFIKILQENKIIMNYVFQNFSTHQKNRIIQELEVKGFSNIVSFENLFIILEYLIHTNQDYTKILFEMKKRNVNVKFDMICESMNFDDNEGGRACKEIRKMLDILDYTKAK